VHFRLAEALAAGGLHHELGGGDVHALRERDLGEGRVAGLAVTAATDHADGATDTELAGVAVDPLFVLGNRRFSVDGGCKFQKDHCVSP